MSIGGRASRLRRHGAVAALVAVALLSTSQSAQAVRPVERRFAQMVNDTRTTATLSPMRLTDRLSDIARKHSSRMADQGHLYHSDLRRLLGPGTTSVGENVGTGSGLEELLQAFLESPPHAHNLLGDFTRTGIGVVRVDGRYWITQVFAA